MYRARVVHIPRLGLAAPAAVAAYYICWLSVVRYKFQLCPLSAQISRQEPPSLAKFVSAHMRGFPKLILSKLQKLGRGKALQVFRHVALASAAKVA